MHVLQSKHSKLKQEESEELLKRFNVSRLQLPKIKKTDLALPEDAKIGDIVRIERKVDERGEKAEYYRVVSP